MSTLDGAVIRCRFCGSEEVAQVVRAGNEWSPWCVECWEKATVKMANRKRNIRDYGISDAVRRPPVARDVDGQ